MNSKIKKHDKSYLYRTISLNNKTISKNISKLLILTKYKFISKIKTIWKIFMNYNESNLKITIQNITLNYVIKQNSSNYLTCQVLKKKSQNILNQIIMQVRFGYFTYRKYFLSNNNASKYIIIYGNQQNLASMGNL